MNKRILLIALLISAFMNLAQSIRNHELWEAAALAEGHLDMCMAYVKGEWKQ